MRILPGILAAAIVFVASCTDLDDVPPPVAEPGPGGNASRPTVASEKPTAEEHVPVTSSPPRSRPGTGAEGQIASLDKTKNDPVPDDWTAPLVSNFTEKSPHWRDVQRKEGVRRVLGKPDFIRKSGVRYRCRMKMVAEIWSYSKFMRTGVYRAPEPAKVVIGFDSEGNTLYCASVSNRIP